MKKALVVALVGSAFAAGSAFGSASVWRVFATGNDSSDYGAYASASADAPRSQALALRATSSPGKSVDVTFYLSCQGERTITSGQLIAVSVATSKKCSLNASANTDYAGHVKVELLRR